MRIYISGPMTSHPDLNRHAFDAAEKRLCDEGHFVINPHDLSPLFGMPAELAEAFAAAYTTNEYMPEARLARCVMDADLAAVRSCDAIYLLRGWENSRGAKKELAEALAHGLTVLQEGDVK